MTTTTTITGWLLAGVADHNYDVMLPLKLNLLKKIEILNSEVNISMSIR